MALFGRHLAVSIPDSVLEDKESLRDKTAKLGLIARACSIFGVDLVEVFRDPSLPRSEMRLVVKVMGYLETPQYLRRRLYPLDEELRYAGILPPLRIPSHKAMVSLQEVPVGDQREGVVEKDGRVDVGLEEEPRMNGPWRAGERVTVRVASKNPFLVERVRREEAGDYWGYLVESRSLAEVFSDPRFRLKIATSRKGDPVGSSMSGLVEAMGRAEGVKLVFGSPSKGLYEMVGRSLGQKADFVLNLFPDQHVETVRTEEAIFAGLNLVNLLMSEKGLSA